MLSKSSKGKNPEYVFQLAIEPQVKNTPLLRVADVFCDGETGAQPMYEIEDSCPEMNQRMTMNLQDLDVPEISAGRPTENPMTKDSIFDEDVGTESDEEKRTGP